MNGRFGLSKAILIVAAAILPQPALAQFVPPLGYTISTAVGTSGIIEGAIATAQPLSLPLSIARDTAGNVYIAAFELNKIYKLATNGTLSTFAGTGEAGPAGDGGPAVAAQLNSPSSLAVDSAGDVYIADTGNQRIRKVSVSTGIINSIAGSNFGNQGDGGPAVLARFSFPEEIAVDGNFNVYVADSVAGRIRRIDPGGGISTFAGAGVGYGASSGDGGPAYSATFTYIYGLAADSQGNLYVIDDNVIRRIDATTGIITTVAGNGDAGCTGECTNGDGGPATDAPLNYPESIAVDSAGNLFIGADTLREVTFNDSIIHTIAGNGEYGFAGDGGPASNAEFSFITGIAVDPSGNIDLADFDNYRIRRIDASTLVIQTVAGGAVPGYADGPAESAKLFNPASVATDTTGNLYIADEGNRRIRKLSTDGTVSTIAGTGQIDGLNGDGGPATLAQLYDPKAVAVDGSGNIYVVDNNRVRIIRTNGIIDAYAGTGSYGNSGDDGSAIDATFSFPSALAVDSSNNLYIADQGNNRVRVVNSDQQISAYAGTGTFGYSGDGGPATQAQLSYPTGIAVDKSRNLYILEGYVNRIRKVDSSGIISTFAFQGGSGVAVDNNEDVYVTQYSSVSRVDPASGFFQRIASASGLYGSNGDGGPALSALLSAGAVAVDSNGNVYVADPDNNIIRKLTPLSPPTAASLTLVPNGLSFAGTASEYRNVSIRFDSQAAFDWAANASTTSGGNWLSVQSNAGTGDTTLGIVTQPSGLAPGIYKGTITVTSAQAANGSAVVSVTLIVPKTALQSSKDVVAVTGAHPAPQTFTVTNVSTGTLDFDVSRSIVTPQGSNWFSVSPASGTTPGAVTLTIDTTGLPDGNYLGGVTVTSASASSSIYVPVTLDKTNQPATIVLNRNQVYFNSPNAGVDPASQIVNIENGGDLTLNWTAIASSAGNWLSVTPASGSNSGLLTLSAAAGSLAVGTYTGTITVSANGATNSPVVLPVIFRVGSTVTGPYLISTIAGPGQITEGGDAAAQAMPPLNAVAIDALGNLYVAATDRHKIFKISANGTLATFAGTGTAGPAGDGGPATAAQLNSPRSVAVDSNGNVYIADTYNYRVRKVDAVTGIITTVAGNGLYGFSGDGGPGTMARMSSPSYLAADGNGNIYVGEYYRVRKIDGDGIITTVAGTGINGFSGDQGPATAAQIGYLSGLASDSSGNLYIAENYRIRKVSGGTIDTFAGTGACCSSGDNGPATSAGLNGTRSLAVDLSGNVYIGDYNRLRMVDTNGTITTIAGNGSYGFGGDGGNAADAQLGSLAGIAINPTGDVFLADSSHNRIRKITSNDWTIETVAGNSPGYSGESGDSALSALFYYPAGVAADLAGNVFVADERNHRVRKIATNGTITTVAGTGTPGFSGDLGPATNAQLSYPIAVAVDGAGNLIIADNGNGRIRKVATDGTISTVAGNGTCCGFDGDGGPATDAQLNSPQAVAVDASGEIYIADSGNYRVRKVGLDGLINTIVGTGVYGTSGNGGPGVQAQIGYVRSLALDSAGNLYIGDGASPSIRKLSTTTGIITGLSQSGYNVVTDAADDIISGYTCNLSLYPPSSFSTNIGGASCGLSGDGGPAISAAINVSSITTDAFGDIFFSDVNNHVIRKLSPVPDGSAVLSILYPPGVNLSVSQVSPATSMFLNLLLSGNGNFTWSGSTSVTTPAGGDWLHLNTSSGSTNEYFYTVISIDATGLPVGIYNGSVTFTSPQAVNGSVTIPVTVTVYPTNNPVPTLSSVNPTNIPLGSPDTTITLNGTNFITGSVGRIFNGNYYTDLSTTSTSPTQTTAVIPANDLTSDATFGVTVVNSGPGGGTSNSVVLTVGAGGPPPTITGISPPSGNPGSSVAATISGTSLSGASQVLFSGSGVTATFGSGSSISLPVNITIASDAEPGTRTVTVVTYAGSSNAFSGFTVNDLTPPSISISPRSLYFLSDVGMNPGDQSLDIAKVGGGGFDWSAVSLSSGWLSVTPNSGSGDATLIVSADSAGLAAGTYTGTISISSAQALNSPVILPVTYRVGKPPTGGYTASTVLGQHIIVEGGSALTQPLPLLTGLARDADGNLYIAARPLNKVFKITPGGVLTTYAGNGEVGSGGDHGLATAAQLNYPHGLTVDANGNLYIADSANRRVRKVTPEGIITTFAGTGSFGFSGDNGPATSASFLFPTGLAFDAAGNLYIADRDNHRIRKVDTNGIITTVAGTGTAGFAGDGGAATSANLYSPVGVAVDSDGNVYIADQSNNRIRRIDAISGNISTFAGNGSSGSSGDNGLATSAAIGSPETLAFDSTGNLYLTTLNRIRKISTNGVITTVAGTGFGSFNGDGQQATSTDLHDVWGIVFDATDSLIFADSWNHRVRRIESDGTVMSLAGAGSAEGPNPSPSTVQLLNADGVATDLAGNIYVADTHRHRIIKVMSDGTVTVIAGTGVAGFSGDNGPATAAQMNRPIGISVDTAGNVYFADQGNNRIRRIGTNGVIETVAGNGTAGFSGDSGPATAAQLNSPYGVATDATGTLYIADTANNRILAVDSAGNIRTIAGTGVPGSGGDNGLATAAQLSGPRRIAVDSSGALYIADSNNSRVRVVSGGIMKTIGIFSGVSSVAIDTDGSTLDLSAYNFLRKLPGGATFFGTFAGTGASAYSGDGGSALSATFTSDDLTVDSSSNIYTADLESNVVRKLTPADAVLSVSPATTRYLTYTSSNIPVLSTTININSEGSSLSWTATPTVSTPAGGAWLGVSTVAGTGSGSIIVTATRGNLGAGTYIGNVEIASAGAANGSVNVPVVMIVPEDTLAVSPATIQQTAGVGIADPPPQTVAITNLGVGSFTFVASGSITTPPGGNWLSISPLAGNSGDVLTLSFHTAGLTIGTYDASIKINSTDATSSSITIPVKLNMVAASPLITVAPLKVHLDSPTGAAVQAKLDVVNTGSGTFDWTATMSGGPFSVSPASGSGDGSITVTATEDITGNYTGTIIITAAGAVNSPVVVPVSLRVGPALTSPYSISTVAGPINLVDGGAALDQPLPRLSGIALDTAGNVYVAGQSRGQIYKITPQGTFSIFAGTGQPGHGGDGGPATSAQFFSPQDLAFDSNGNLYVADAAGGNSSTIRKIDVNGIVTTIAGYEAEGGYSGDGGPATQALLNFVRGVAVDAAGNVYIADTTNHRVRKVDVDGIISTIAGTGIEGFSGDGGPATSAELSAPWAVLPDVAGNLYISDQGNHRIRRVDVNGMITTIAGNGSSVNSGDGGLATLAGIAAPTGMALDSTTGTLYIADATSRVRAVYADGTIATAAGIAGSGFSGDGGSPPLARLRSPADIAVDAANNLYISDSSNNRVRLVNAADTLIQTIAGNGPPGFGGDNGPANQAEFQVPASVASDSTGTLYIADQLNNRIRKVDANGTVTTFGGTGVTSLAGTGSMIGDGGLATAAAVSSPQGVAADPAGNVYVADTNHQRIRKIAVSGGIITTVAGTGIAGFGGDGGPATSAQLNFPRSIAVDSLGNLYIGDNNNARIRKVTPDGLISTVAGTGIPGFSGDGGPAVSAQISPSLFDLTVDAEGNLYFTDSGNLREVRTDGIIQTLQSAIDAATADATGTIFASTSFTVNRLESNNSLTPIAGGTFSGMNAPRLYGEGIPALAAGIEPVNSLATDDLGNIYATDTVHHLIRKISPMPSGQTALTTSRSSLDFKVCSASPVLSQDLIVNLEGTGTLTWNATLNLYNQANWLGLSTTSGSGTSGTITLTADATGFPVGILGGILTITSPDALNPSIDIPVSLSVESTCNPAPTLTSINPPEVSVGSPGQLITLTGTNFVPGSVVQAQSISEETSSPVDTTYVSPTQLTVFASASDLSEAGSFIVHVDNPLSGGGSSNSLPFNIVSGPIITGIDPSSGTAPSTVSAHISGTNLDGATSVNFSGTGLIATIQPGGTADLLPVTITIADNAPSGIQKFTVTTDKGTSSPFSGFSVTGQPPVINSLTANPVGVDPAVAPVYGLPFTMTIGGRYFAPGAVVSAGASELTTTFIDSTLLSATVPSSVLTVAGPVVITVTNPDLQVSSPATLKVIERGDINANGTINIGDALVCALTVGGVNKPPLISSVGDVNLDGTVNIGDCLVDALFSGRVLTNFYTPTVASLSPNPVSPGETLTVSGNGIYGAAADIRVDFPITGSRVTRTIPSNVSTGSLTVPVPGEAVSGPLQIYRLDAPMGGNEYPLYVTATPTPLVLTGVAPLAGVAPGDSVILYGMGFSATPESNAVLFKSAAGRTGATVTAASTTSLTVTVPSDAVCGPVTVTTGEQTSDPRAVLISATSCGVQLLDIVGHGMPGETIVLEGAGFDIGIPANNVVTFTSSGGGTVAGTVLQAGGTQLQVHVPATAVAGDITVTVNGVMSNALTYAPSP